MQTVLFAEQDTIADLEDRIAQLVNQKGDMDAELKDLEERLAEAEGGSEELLEKNRKKEEECEGLKRDVENLELNLQKAEQEKQTKDNQIKTLNEEMARQDETIGKLGKDKKALEETIKKTQADLAAEEDKVNHLNKLKQKLESQIDEVRCTALPLILTDFRSTFVAFVYDRFYCVLCLSAFCLCLFYCSAFTFYVFMHDIKDSLIDLYYFMQYATEIFLAFHNRPVFEILLPFFEKATF